MKVILKICVLLLFSILVVSCEDNNVKSWGKTKYYPAFLWMDENFTPTTKTIVFDFSQDAKNDPNCFAEFQFVDNAGNVILSNEMTIKVDGKNMPNNTFKVNSRCDSVNIEIAFTPSASSGDHQGYLRLVNHDLDRLDSQPISKGQIADAFQWTVCFEKNMNPLAVVLMWIGIVLLAAFILWMTIFRYLFFPRFRAIRKSIIIPNQAPIVINFKGARMIVLDKVKHKQSLWNRMWTGTIVYKQNSSLTSAITLIPTSKGQKVLFRANLTNYKCFANPIDNQPVKITDVVNNQQIYIQ